MIIVDEVGEEIGHHFTQERTVKYSVQGLLPDQRKEILNHCNSNKQDGGFIMLYRCPFTEADQVMLDGAEVSCSVILWVTVANSVSA